MRYQDKTEFHRYADRDLCRGMTPDYALETLEERRAGWLPEERQAYREYLEAYRDGKLNDFYANRINA